MSLADLAIGIGVTFIATCGAVIVMWFADPLRGPDDQERP